MAKTINMMAAVAVFAGYGLEAINEELEARKLPKAEAPEAGATLLATGTRSLQEFAATVCNLSHGSVTGKDLTPLLAKAFPEHNITDRHGPHYMSACRSGDTGNVVVRHAPEKGRRPTAPAKPVTVDLSGVDPKRLERIVKAVEGTPLEAIVAASLAPKAEEKAAEPAPAEGEQPAAS
jgi:hypothetical protein